MPHGKACSSSRPTGRGVTPIRAGGLEIELIIGRSLAACVHPFAAWRILPRWKRLGILVAYSAFAYVAVLGVLFTL